MRLHLAAVLAGYSLGASQASAQGPEADPADVASPQALVDAAYAAIARAPGKAFTWDRFRSLFLEGAHLIPNTEQRGGQFVILSPQDFIDWIEANTTIGGPDDRGFIEGGVHNVVEEYGDIAHVFSTYEKHLWNDPRVIGGGINSFQMVRKDGRWWITGIIWDEPGGAGPIPEQYRPRQ